MYRNQGMIQRAPHFPNVLRGKTPTFEGWTVNPTDAENMTDGDLTTAMTTGSKTLSAGYQYAKCVYEVPAGLYLIGMRGYATCYSASPYVYFSGDGVRSSGAVGYGYVYTSPGFLFTVESNIAIEITAKDSGTVTPHIYEFYAVRLGDL